MDFEFLPVGHNQTGMDYPSTTQALFALIVMIIVLLFILVYCCWGTMTCGRPAEQTTPSTEDLQATGQGQNQSVNNESDDNTRAVVIFPFNSMIYVGDGQNRRIYHIPADDEKPPSYTDLCTTNPPPPYSVSIPPTGDVGLTHTEHPPSYEDYLAAVRTAITSTPLIISNNTIENSVISTPTPLSSTNQIANDIRTTLVSSLSNERPTGQNYNHMPNNISIVLKGSSNRISYKPIGATPNENNREQKESTNTDHELYPMNSNNSWTSSPIPADDRAPQPIIDPTHEDAASFNSGTYQSSLSVSDSQGTNSTSIKETDSLRGSEQLGIGDDLITAAESILPVDTDNTTYYTRMQNEFIDIEDKPLMQHDSGIIGISLTSPNSQFLPNSRTDETDDCSSITEDGLEIINVLPTHSSPPISLRTTDVQSLIVDYNRDSEQTLQNTTSNDIQTNTSESVIINIETDENST